MGQLSTLDLHANVFSSNLQVAHLKVDVHDGDRKERGRMWMKGGKGNHHVHHFNVRVLSFLLRALYISPIVHSQFM